MLTFDSYVPIWASTQIDEFDRYRTVWEKDVKEIFPGWTTTRLGVVRVEMARSMLFRD